MRERQVIDCFRFHNEFEILKLRLQILEDVVDWFVLAEANLSHSGEPKPYHFEQNKGIFKRWLPKIRHVVVEDMPANASNYQRERYQMDAVRRGLTSLKSQDAVIIGDIDEIPNPTVIRMYKASDGIVGLKSYNGIFYINCENFTVPWFNPKIVTRDIVLRNTPSAIRDYQAEGWGHFYEVGGWHFSYCGGLQQYDSKIRSFSHANQVPPGWKDLTVMKRILEDPENEADAQFCPVRIRKVDRSFPDYVRNHQRDLIAAGLIWQPGELP